MDFELSDEQQDIGRTVRTWLADRMNLSVVREYTAGEVGDLPVDLMKAASELGWLGVSVPEEFGGLGLGLLDAAVIAEALGGGLAPTFVANTIAACEVLRIAGDAAQQRTWLEPVAAGELLVATSLRDEGGGWDESGVSITADSRGMLRGSAGIIEFASSADILLIAARSSQGLGIHVVRTEDRGVSLESVDPLDRTVRASRVRLEDVASERLTNFDETTYSTIVERLTVLTCADLIGAADRAIDITVDYLKTRRQFGRAIGSFQAIQHEMAELYVSLATISHAVRYTAYAHDAGLDDASTMTSIVKAQASEFAKKLAAAMVQFHGAIGVTWEHDAHLFFKRLHRDAYDFGDTACHLDSIASGLITTANPSTPTLEGIAS